ncbi:MAG: hypothetical protein KME32_32130 [Mojavia pulchra JT2-VF2]|jgi:nitric oxide synthase oxygenase domain/subunit|uniref:Uncharacterized protein n=1 Tax=Mojavia pulchra JT2-VF2 TaxID=287848 RepID=A0A951Q7P1_9NOST|nr:hypothetical protein [Mojavia pulchra JT2-VF2]
MPRDLEILKKGDWFLAEGQRDNGSFGYPIYYRHAISYSIGMNITRYDKNKDWVAEEINKLIKSVKDKQPYKHDNFLELHPLTVSVFQSKGFVLVDQTNSYYPLMFYDDDSNRDGKERVSSLTWSLDAISKNLDEVYAQLYRLKVEDWTSDFQDELLEIYAHKPS